MYRDSEQGETGIELSQLPQNGYTNKTPRLHKAVEDLNFEAIRTLIEIGEDVNMKDQDGNTVLHTVIQGHKEYVNDERQQVILDEKKDIISILVRQKDIDLNSQNYRGQTPLHLALVHGDKQIISLLLSSTSMPIGIDIQNNKGESCRDLLEKKYPEMILFHLLYTGRTEKFIDLALTKRSLLEKDDGYNTFLQFACEHRSPIIVKELLRLGVDPNGTSPNNKKLPSKIATIKVYPDILRIVLEYCYNVREVDDGNTVIHILVKQKDSDDENSTIQQADKNSMLKCLLLDMNFNINAVNNEGHTIMHLAIIQGNEEIISIILCRKDLDLDSYKYEGESLHKILEKKYPTKMLFHYLHQEKILKFHDLARTKRNLLEEDYNGRTFLQHACDKGSDQIVRTLLHLGVDPMRRGTEPSPFIIAIFKGFHKILKIFLKCPNFFVQEHPDILFYLIYKMAAKRNDENLTDDSDYDKCLELLLHEARSGKLVINRRDDNKNTISEAAIDKHYDDFILKALDVPRKDVDLDGYEYDGKSLREILEEMYPKTLLFHYLHQEKVLKFYDLVRTKRHLLKENYRGLTFLQHACKKGSDKIVKTLLDLRVDPMSSGTGHLDMQPFIIVIDNGFYKILEIFLEWPRFLVRGYPYILFRLLFLMVENRVKNPDYNICLDLLLRETRRGKLDINWLDKDGDTVLDVAIIYDMEDIIFKLLDAGIFINNTNKDGINTLERLDPSLLRKHLDNCIMSTCNESITFNYRSLIRSTKIKPSKSQSSENLTVASIETDLLISMCRFIEFKKLLKHPVITSFLNLKWFAVRKMFYINLIFHLILCLSFTVYVSCKYVSWSINDSPKNSSETPVSIGTETSLLHSTTTDKPNIAESESYKSLHDATAIFWVIFCLRELVQLCISPLWYLKSVENWLEMTTIVIGAYILFQNSLVNHALVAVFMLTSWSEAVLLLGRHPELSIYIEMFKTVTLNFSKSLFLYSPLILAFALSFCFLFSYNIDNPSQEFFVNPFIAFFKIFIMMTGEYDASNFDFRSFPLISHVVFILFVFLLAIVLSSLLSGLAVGDIQMIRSNAELSEIMYRIEMYHYYGNMPILNLLSNMFDSLIKLTWLGNWIQAKLKILKSWFTVVLFPDVMPNYKAYIYWQYDNVVSFSLNSAHISNKYKPSIQHFQRSRQFLQFQQIKKLEQMKQPERLRGVQPFRRIRRFQRFLRLFKWPFQRLFTWRINLDIVEAAKMKIEEKTNSIKENTMEDSVKYCAEQLKLYRPKLESVVRISKHNENMLTKCCEQFQTIENISKQLNASVENVSQRLHAVEQICALIKK